MSENRENIESRFPKVQDEISSFVLTNCLQPIFTLVLLSLNELDSGSFSPFGKNCLGTVITHGCRSKPFREFGLSPKPKRTVEQFVVGS